MSTPVLVQSPGFSASAEPDGDSSVAARLIGTADLTAKNALDDFVSKLHNVAQAHRAGEVVLDFQELEFMNSSCLTGLVAWICAVQELPPDSRYRIVLVSSPAHHWQRRSLNALTCIASDLVSIRA